MTFEKSYKRLEEIVAKLSGTELTLEESIKLYEEADKLIKTCSQTLGAAEKKIEMLVKNRDGNLSCSEMGTPETQPFTQVR